MPDDGLGDFHLLGRRLRWAAAVVGALTVLAVLVAGLRGGLSAGDVLRWIGAGVVVLLVAAAVLGGLHALRAAGSAQRRGERLSGDDVGLLPPRRRPEEEQG